MKPEPSSTLPVKAALFVDFDNIYLGLRNMHPAAAEEFATNPLQWLEWFEQGMPSHETNIHAAVKRNLLLRRCYLNPVSFANFRPFFTRSAFSVIDCPPLTQQGKNSTDIHMVMDILDSLRHETRFDEFIILSGDSDFTPVLLRLRIFDRRTVVLTAGPVAQPYKAASDRVISGDVFIEDGLGILSESPERVSTARTDVSPRVRYDQVLNDMAQRLYDEIVAGGKVMATELPPIFKEFPQFRSSDNWLGFYSLRDLTTELTKLVPAICLIEGDPTWCVSLRLGVILRSDVVQQTAVQDSQVSKASTQPSITLTQEKEELKDQILTRVKELVASSEEPLNMATAAADIIRRAGTDVLRTQWAGAGSFKGLLLAAEPLGFEVITAPGQPGYLYDPVRHEVPSFGSQVDKWVELSPELAAFARRIHSVTGAPFLTPAEYDLVFRALEEELRDGPYFYTATSKAVRDRCIEAGSPIPRKAVNFVLQGIWYAGHRFEQNPVSDTATTFAEVFRDNVLELCKDAQLELSKEEHLLMKLWIRPS